MCGDLSVRLLGQIVWPVKKYISLALCSEIQNVNQAQKASKIRAANNEAWHHTHCLGRFSLR